MGTAERVEFVRANRDEWLKTRDLERYDIDREKAMFESAVEKPQTMNSCNREKPLAADPRTGRSAPGPSIKQLEAENAGNGMKKRSDQSEAELISRAESQKTELTELRETLAREFEKRCEEQALVARIEREEWETVRSHEKSDLLALRDAQETEIRDLRERHVASMTAERTEWQELRDPSRTKPFNSQRTNRNWKADLKRALEREFLANREQHAIAIQTAQDEWEQTRDRETTALEVQLTELLESYERLKLEISSAREQHNLALTSEREDHEVTLTTERNEWEQIRRRDIAILQDQHAKLIDACESLKLELFDLRAQHDTLIAAERDEWEQTRQRQKDEFDSQQTEWLSSRDSMLQASRDALELEFIDLRERHSAANFKTEQAEWQQTLSRRENSAAVGRTSSRVDA